MKPKITWLDWRDIAVLALVGMVAFTGRSLGQARENVSTLLEESAAIPRGYFAPVIETVDQEGEKVVLGSLDTEAAIYLVFDVECPFCEQIAPFWRELVDRYDSDEDVRVIGVSLDSAPAAIAFLKKHDLLMQTAITPDKRTRDIHRFHGVPQTLVLNADGLVRFSRVGVVEGAAAADSLHAVIDELTGSGQ